MSIDTARIRKLDNDSLRALMDGRPGNAQDLSCAFSGAMVGAAHELLDAYDTLTRIREAAGPEVRALSHWLSTVPTAVDSEYSRRADALRVLLRTIDGEQT